MMQRALRLVLCCGAVVSAQQAGKGQIEMPPPVAVAKCTKQGCEMEQYFATMDANWRWTHGQTCKEGQCSSGPNCYTGSEWDETLCEDPEACGKNCALEGITAQQYARTYGVTPLPGGVKLKNREFTMDVDVSTLECGMNGAVYFSEMAEDE